MLSGGRLLVQALKRQGVTTIFTICGGHIEPILQGCLDEGLKVVDMRHEQACVHAAEGWSRFTGKPGVAVLTAGPGVTNGVTGLANAARVGSPLLVIGGRSSLSLFEKGALQEMDQTTLLRPVTKWARTVFEPNRIPEYVATAFRQTLAPPMGPVFLEIPMDLLWGRLDWKGLSPPEMGQIAPVCPPVEELDLVVAMLGEAERPVLVAGTGVFWGRAGRQLRDFAEATGAPVFLNGLGRGCLPTGHPQLFPLARRFAMEQADLVVLIGAELDFRLAYGQWPLFSPEARVVQIDANAGEIGRNRAVDQALVGDVAAILRRLTEGGSRSAGPDRGWWLEAVAFAEEQRRAELGPALNSTAVPINPLRLCREIGEFLDEDAVIIGDGGDIVAFGAQSLATFLPGHWQDPGPFGCLGVGLPFAIAAKLAHPGKQVLVLQGDGTFGFNGMELDTALRHRTPVVVVIGNDAAWGEMKRPQLYAGGRERLIATELLPTRYDLVAQGLGCYGELVERPEDIRPALTRAFTDGRPACLNVMIDPSVAYESPGGRGARGY